MLQVDPKDVEYFGVYKEDEVWHWEIKWETGDVSGDILETLHDMAGDNLSYFLRLCGVDHIVGDIDEEFGHEAASYYPNF